MIANVKAPWWFWAVSVVSLVWNAFGAMDFTMTALRVPAYLAAFPPQMIEYIDSFPLWSMAVWGLGTWGALAGSVLLLLRSRWAIAAFAASLVGLLGTTIYQMLDTRPQGVVATPADMALTGVIWLIALALLWFAVRMARRGVLA